MKLSMTYVCQHCKTAFTTFLGVRSHQNGHSRDGVLFCETRQPVDVRADYSDVDGDKSDGDASNSAHMLLSTFNCSVL